MNFNELNLKQELHRAILKTGYVKATEIQQKAIPVAIDNYDIIGKSHTGTGKTAAFVLPILHNLDVNLKKPQAIILCPTRELATQVLDQVRKYALFLHGVNATLLCGGSQIKSQIYALKKANVVVGTPGRIADHLNRHTLRLNNIKTIVLDEADEMLKMGFKKDIDLVFNNAPQNYQTLLFSATMSKPVLEIANTYQKNPVSITVQKNTLEQNNINQYYIDTYGLNKEEVLIKLYQELKPKLSIIFSNTKMYTEKIAKLLASQGIKSRVINGDKKQGDRYRSMQAFRNQEVSVLIATDVAARGIDVDGVDYVFNYDLPVELESYTHRIGRTARAGAKGTAITFINSRNSLNDLRKIEQYQKKAINPYDISSYNLTKDFSKSHSSSMPKFKKAFDSKNNRSWNKPSKTKKEWNTKHSTTKNHKDYQFDYRFKKTK
ncbi:DEAD/DEAH box helicase [Spiroplasma eriocheiris]|uniref:DEAD-box ATP-dependent RNA helicase n=1 Tax=Spiroplasma eriocheiris TaxID=315358 RepID=A0A0H3XKQ2_9MOLU|nr:DEAD/DEAH box helicase [Spiroplasma eriocheiris]AHF57562.1 putative ATP-dependent RNA helicase [Spiroplasma eriocheiris CCTCC M 207170]AKM54019.1 DEAD-box ATP-dependent RNA helicase [Spiroplasma eriocheiris]